MLTSDAVTWRNEVFPASLGSNRALHEVPHISKVELLLDDVYGGLV